MGFTKLLSGVKKYCNRIHSGGIIARYYSGIVESECGKKVGENEKQNEGQQSSGEDNKSGLVLGVYESEGKFELTTAAEEINQKSGGKIYKYLNEYDV